MIKASASASGKIILLGEHLVVYGAPAIAAGIERGARAEATLRGPSAESRLLLGGDAIAVSASATDDRARAFAALLTEGHAAPPIEVTAESDLPPGGGLGSSAALGVAIARAVSELAARAKGEALAPEGEALARASAWERVFHGNPSGIDTAAAATGGCFRFTRADGIRPIALRRALVLCVGSSGTSSSTRSMVEGVARLRSRKPELFEQTKAGVTSLVQNAALAIEASDVSALGKLMDLNQMLLAGLMLSTEAIESLCSLARGAGALGAKLTGAGGGGSVIALVGSPEDDEAETTLAAEQVLLAWKNAGFNGFVTRIRKREDSA
jgi:mevalonate kinase